MTNFETEFIDLKSMTHKRTVNTLIWKLVKNTMSNCRTNRVVGY